MEIKKVPLLNKENTEQALSIGSGCVIVKDGKVLMVRGKGGDSFKFPGGHIIDTENFTESATRETLEEIGCNVRVNGNPVFYLFKFSESLNIILIHYLADIVEGVPAPTTEIEEIQWFEIKNLPANIFDNVKPVLKSFGLL